MLSLAEGVGEEVQALQSKAFVLHLDSGDFAAAFNAAFEKHPRLGPSSFLGEGYLQAGQQQEEAGGARAEDGGDLYVLSAEARKSHLKRLVLAMCEGRQAEALCFAAAASGGSSGGGLPLSAHELGPGEDLVSITSKLLLEQVQ